MHHIQLQFQFWKQVSVAESHRNIEGFGSLHILSLVTPRPVVVVRLREAVLPLVPSTTEILMGLDETERIHPKRRRKKKKEKRKEGEEEEEEEGEKKKGLERNGKWIGFARAMGMTAGRKMTGDLLSPSPRLLLPPVHIVLHSHLHLVLSTSLCV